jgi:YesN/AraC family two-component response regulator
MKSFDVAGGLKRWIDEHYAEIQSLKDCEPVIGKTYKHSSHCFRWHFGMTSEEYLLRKRIEISKEFLHSTALPIIDVIRRVGGKDDVNFRKQFREREHCTMSEYRMNHCSKKPSMQMLESFSPPQKAVSQGTKTSLRDKS